MGPITEGKGASIWPEGYDGTFKVVAFLQNAYFKNPNSPALVGYYDHTPKAVGMRGACLLQSRSGKNLKSVLGDIYNLIYWTNASSTITGTSGAKPKPDYTHILRTLDDCKPNLVLCFGAYAFDAVSKAIHDDGRRQGAMNIYRLKHPSPRSFDPNQLLGVTKEISLHLPELQKCNR